jgi:hypothetical protein
MASPHWPGAAEIGIIVGTEKCAPWKKVMRRFWSPTRLSPWTQPWATPSF